MKRVAIAAACVAIGCMPVPGAALLALVVWRRANEVNRVVVHRSGFVVHQGGKTK